MHPRTNDNRGAANARRKGMTAGLGLDEAIVLY